MTYADNAATTRLSDAALSAMMPYLKNSYGNPSSLYSFGQEAHDAVENARGQMARVLNAQPGEVFFTSCGTESDNWALRGIAETLGKKGKHIIVSSIEHHAILHTAQYLKGQGFRVTYLPVTDKGVVTPEALENAMEADTILVSVMLANNEVGTLQPIRELAEIAHKHGAKFHTDAVQAVGHIPVDVQALGVDLLSLSGHKFGGPRGVGALYVKQGTPLAPFILGGGQEKGRRSGTENVAGVAGMAAALTEAVAKMPAESRRLIALRDRLIAGLLEIPRSRATGDPVNRLPGHASMIFECVEGESMVLRLDAEGVCCSSGSACSSASLEPSHVLLAIGLPHEIAHGSLRLTLGEDTTEQDIDHLLDVIPRVVATLRELSPIWAA
ncbi:MAG: cysteine desulfurase NifS [Oscillospiraceae bacterium]